AGAAPLGPEVDEDGDAGVLDDLVEELGVGGDGLVDGRERVFAGAAAAGVGEGVGGDAGLLGAVRGGSGGWDRSGSGGIGCGEQNKVTTVGRRAGGERQIRPQASRSVTRRVVAAYRKRRRLARSASVSTKELSGR